VLAQVLAQERRESLVVLHDEDMPGHCRRSHATSVPPQLM
jgi:hypothetical protein